MSNEPFEPQVDEGRLGCFTFLHAIAGCLVVSATIIHTHSTGFGRTLAVILGVVFGALFYVAIDILDWRVSQLFLRREERQSRPMSDRDSGRMGGIMVALCVVWCILGFELGDVIAKACSRITLGHT